MTDIILNVKTPIPLSLYTHKWNKFNKYDKVSIDKVNTNKNNGKLNSSYFLCLSKMIFPL